MQLALLDYDEEGLPQRDFDAMRRLRLAWAAEHLVCSDVLERGFDAQMASEGLPYDVIADIGGLRRIQVKSAMLRRRPVTTTNGKIYDYSVYRFKAHGKLSEYAGKADLLAFVAVDHKFVVYARPENALTEVRLSPDRLPPGYCDLSWSEAVRGWG